MNSILKVRRYYKGKKQKMKDQGKSKAKLLEEIAVLRQKLIELEASATTRKQAEKDFSGKQRDTYSHVAVYW